MILVAIAMAVVIVDRLSKAAINTYLQVGESVPVISGLLHFTHVENSGAAFGIMQNQQPIFMIVGVILVVSTIVFYRRIRKEGLMTTVALSLVLGGAIGNLIDRAINGMVTDFIDIRVWPVFNVADSAIVVGAVLLSVNLVLLSKNENRNGSLRLQTVDEAQVEKVANHDVVNCEEMKKCSKKGMDSNATRIV